MKLLKLYVVLGAVALLGAAQGWAKPFAYVPNQGSNNVSVIDVATDSVVTNLRAGISPVRVAIHPNNEKVYVANIGSDRVTPINTTNNSVGRFIIVGDSPAEILISPDGSQVYTPNAQSSDVTVINTVTESVITNLPAGYNCRAIQWVTNSIGSHVYVANQGAGTVTIIDPQSLTVDRTVAVGGGPRRLAVTPDGTRVYVTNYQTDDVSVIDALTRTKVGTIPVGDAPRGVAVTPNGEEIWVTNLQGNSISIISRATETVVTNLPAGILPWTVIFNYDGTRAYILNSGNYNVSLFDVPTRQLIKTIPVGNGCFWAEFNADGTKLYVTNPPEGTVSVIDTVNNINIGTIPTGLSAWVIALQKDDPPQITGIYPNAINAGTTAQMSVLGDHFRLGAAVALQPSVAGATISNVSVLSSNEMAFTLALTTNATTGLVGLRVTNIDGTTVTAPDILDILPPPPPAPPPSISAAGPTEVMAGHMTQMTIAGADFQPGASVTVLGNDEGLSVSGALTVDANTIIFDLTVAPTAPTGPHGLTVTNPDSQSDSQGNLFTVVAAPPPTVTSLAPSQVPAGTTQPMTLSGTGFLVGAAVAPVPNDPGLTVTNLEVVNDGTITFDLVIAVDAPAGLYGFTVTNPDAQAATGNDLFTITEASPPTVSSVDVPQIVQGETWTMTVTGSGFVPGASVAATPDNAGITISNAQVLAADTLTLTISVAVDAPTGSRGLVVTNPDLQMGSGADLFTIEPLPALSVANCDPATVSRGATATLTINGTGFVPNSSVIILGGGAQVQLVGSSYVDSTHMSMTVSVTSNAAPGWRGVRVNNPDGQSSSLSQAFRVQ
jgi:YVTN family beta-propeller protein